MTNQTNPAASCRQRCYDNGHVLALLRNSSVCSCNSTLSLLALLLPTPCGAGSWNVYRVHHVTTTTELTMRAGNQTMTGRSYTKPSEDVGFFATLDLSIDTTFNFTFDDGVTLLTAAPPVYHSFATARAHQVKVSAWVGVVQVGTSFKVDIQDVDEGRAPDLVALTSYHEMEPRTALHSILVVDEEVSNCSFRFGDGATLGLPLFQDFGSSQRMNHTYGICGRYNAVVDCSNTHGSVTDNYVFTAREWEPVYSSLTYGNNYSVPAAGNVSFLKVTNIYDKLYILSSLKKSAA